MNYFYLTKIRKEHMYIMIVLTAKYMHYKFYAFGSEKNPDIHLLISISKLRHFPASVLMHNCIYAFLDELITQI